jgi:hypothetical protein
MAKFIWSRHRTGSWSGHGYEIKRDRPGALWRMLRDGQHFDAVPKLPDAKAACERDFARRAAKLPSVDAARKDTP